MKAEVLLTPERHYRGYQRLGANVTRFEGGYVRDWHEALDYFREEDNAAVQVRGWGWTGLPGSFRSRVVGGGQAGFY